MPNDTMVGKVDSMGFLRLFEKAAIETNDNDLLLSLPDGSPKKRRAGQPKSRIISPPKGLTRKGSQHSSISSLGSNYEYTTDLKKVENYV